MSSALRRRSKGVLFLSLPVANIFVFVVESLPYKKLVVGIEEGRKRFAFSFLPNRASLSLVILRPTANVQKAR